MKSSDDPTELTFETKGFRKIGLLDFKTRPIQHDLKTLGSQITEEAARNVWSSGAYGDAQELEAYDDHFLVQFDFQLKAFELPATAQLDARRQPVLVDIMRRSSR
jgi:hypothetical protein